MGIAIADVVKEATSNPALETELFSSFKDKFLTNLKAEGVVIRNADEEKEFISNYEKTVIPEKVKAQIGEKVKEVHDQYDNDLFELTGERKQGTEKTYEFLKRKIAEIKAAQKKGNDDPVLADKLKDLETKLAERKDWVSPDKLKEVETKYFTENVNGRVLAALDKMPIAAPAHITEDKAKQEYATMQRDMLKVNFLNKFTAKRDDDGNIVYYEGDKIQTHPQTAKPLTEAELIAKHYAGYFVPETKGKTGAGTGKAAGGSGKDVNEASLKTKQDVMNYLKEKLAPQGVKQGSAKFNTEYTRILTEYGITE